MSEEKSPCCNTECNHLGFRNRIETKLLNDNLYDFKQTMEMYSCCKCGQRYAIGYEDYLDIRPNGLN